MKFKKIMSAVTSAAVSIALTGSIGIYADEEKVIKTDTFYAVMKNITDDGVRTQWYTANDTSFRRDGLSVSTNGVDISDECEVVFPEGVSPRSAFDGKNLDYQFPITINYGENAFPADMITKIGKYGDTNMDLTVDVRDTALIARDVPYFKKSGESRIPAFGRFLTTGNRNEGVYDVSVSDAAGIAGKLAKEAIKNSSSKKYETEGSGKYALTLSRAVGLPGETVAIQVVVGAGDKFEGLDAVIEWEGGSVDLGDPSALKDSYVSSAADGNKIAIINYGKAAIADGGIASIPFTIPSDAEPGTSYDVHFTDVNTFSILAADGSSSDVKDEVKVKGTNVTVLKPSNYDPSKKTTPAVTTAAVTTTTSVTTVTTTAAETDTANKTTQPPVTTVSAQPITSNTSQPVTTSAGEDLTTAAVNTAAESTTATSVSVSASTAAATVPVDAKTYPLGDANHDQKVNIRDAAHIAKSLAMNIADKLPIEADYNGDGKVNIRDAAALAKDLAMNSVKTG